jgi:2-keto-4-pentenoate hydratase
MNDRVRLVAEKLAEARRTGKKVTRLTDELRPRDEREAASVRETLMRLRRSRHAGWKVALSRAGELIASPVLSDGFLTSPARVSLGQAASLGIETELAFRIKRAFPVGGEMVTRPSVVEAIDAVMPALELLDSRFEAGFSSPRLDLLADHLGNFGIVLGAPLQNWRERDLTTLKISLTLTGSTTETINGSHPLGDPIAPLFAFAERLADEGGSIEPGDVVITGSWTGVRTIAAGSRAVVTVDEDVALELTVCGPAQSDERGTEDARR